jgi:hypothetical protein
MSMTSFSSVLPGTRPKDLEAVKEPDATSARGDLLPFPSLR